MNTDYATKLPGTGINETGSDSVRKVQAASGAFFALFVAAHLVNTAFAAFGIAAYDGVQGALRIVYQAFVIEVALLAALGIHIVAGITRMVTERRRVRSIRAKWHRVAGIFLMIFIGGHIFAVRGPSWFYGVYPGFEGLAFSIDYAPYYFFPYYFLLGVAGFYHALNGLSVGLPRLGLRLALGNVTLVRATACAAIVMTAALLGLAGVWTDTGAPYESEFAKLAMEIWNGLTT